MKIRVIAQFADDVLQTVMAAVSAAEFELRHAWREIQLVVSHQNFIRINTIEGCQRRHGFTAEVHKGGWHQQAYIFPGQINAGGVAKKLTFFTQRGAKALCQ